MALLAALSIMMLVGSAAMALDLGNLYLRQAINQRIADQSARAAAFAYSQSSSSSTAQSAAASLATANGAGNATITTSLVPSPSGDGNNALKVVISSVVALSPFGQTISASGPTAGLLSSTVSATAYAEIHQATPCVIALTNSGVTATGGINATATSCAIASNGSVTDSSGARITASAIYAVGSISATNGGSISTNPSTGQLFPGSSTTADPFASAGVFSRLPTVAAMTAPSFPAVGSAPSGGSPMTCSGTLNVSAGSHGTISGSSPCTINFAGGAETDVSGSGLSLTNGNITLNFAAGTYKINGLSMSGYGTVTINTTGTVVLDIWNGITFGGSTSLTVNGPATYNIQGGITNNSSGAIAFNNSASPSSASTFAIAGGIAIANGTASFPNGSYTITSGDSSNGAGIDISGGTTATFGNGSFVIAKGINIGGGGKLTIGSALNSSSVFQIPSVMTAGYALQTSGGSTLTLGSFTNYDIDGPVALAGSVALGTGVYTINGSLNAGSSGGGSITGTSVQLIASGAVSFGAGYSTISLSAPTAISSSTVATSPTVVLASNSTAASSITAGASNTIVVGAVYLPSAPLTFSGSGTLTGNGNCLQVVVTGLAFSGGTSLATTCTSLGTSSAASVSLVQ